jgi:enoyl-CoA hydratase/carnithine racemase
MEKLETLEVGREGPRGWIRLNRPDKLNPLGGRTLHELITAAAWASQEEGLKVVVVSGSGRAFSSGAELGTFRSGASAGGADSSGAREAADLGRRMVEAVESIRAVTVASIRGHCVGGGVLLAAACDLRWAEAGTRFAIPELDLGIPLAWGGIPRLVREIGPALTKELVMTCRPFDAEEAARIGLVNRVLPAGELDAGVESLVGELVAKSAYTLSATKAHVNAVTAQMVGVDRSWADADGLVVAQRDPDSRAVAENYLRRLSR